MEIKKELLNREEVVAFALQELYHSYGYKTYKMSKFEPYDLYVQNKSFIVGDSILTFTDTNGKLMALKPDVTLSIIKNYKSGQQKVYYNENVYREGSSTHEFAEIMQVGLECIGDIDMYSQCEVLTLAEESLKRISKDYILDVASVGVISGLMSATDADDSAKKSLLKYMQDKNVHNIRRLCTERGIPETISHIWQELASLYGPLGEMLTRLSLLCINREMSSACDELSQLSDVMKDVNGKINLNLDFSIISNLSYYNGLVFKGYVRELHSIVVSGGRYDNLMEKMGKNAGAIGFAVYLDLLRLLPDDMEVCEADVLLSYGADVPAAEVAAKASELRAQGLSVKVQPMQEDVGRYRQKISL